MEVVGSDKAVLFLRVTRAHQHAVAVAEKRKSGLGTFTSFSIRG